jgi:hypothetical protein
MPGMRARYKKALRSAATAALAWINRGLDRIVGWALREDEARPAPAAPPPPRHADERTVHRMAEAERGGMSTEASAVLYESGENPGGLHHKAVRREGPEHPRPQQEEPQERKERVPGGARRIPVIRRGG